MLSLALSDLNATVRTDGDVVERISALEAGHSDFFGFIRSDLIDTLSFADAKPFLKPETTAADWRPEGRSIGEIVTRIRDYLPFAWDKANNRRGLSAGRSINHFQAWLWLAGEDKAAAAIEEYSHYGKPQLRAISKAVSFDWVCHDDGDWTENEGVEGCSADGILELDLMLCGPLAASLSGEG